MEKCKYLKNDEDQYYHEYFLEMRDLLIKYQNYTLNMANMHIESFINSELDCKGYIKEGEIFSHEPPIYWISK